MSEDAEKLINLSLCKMAESRTIRRGGTSLHKHLLISTVLTKARSAYFETWYMGDAEVTDSRNGRTVDLNSSYQELDFPLDEDDDDTNDLEASMTEAPSDSYYKDLSSSTSQNVSDQLDNRSSAVADKAEGRDDANFDPRFFVEVGTESESEIELPSDILNCVEKMGDISDMSFTVDESASTPPTSPNAMDEPHVKNAEDEENSLQQSSQLLYLDLDSPLLCTTKDDCTDRENNNNDKSAACLENEEIPFGPPAFTSTPHKRRRSWDFDEPSSSDEDEANEFPNNEQSCQFRLSEEFIGESMRCKSRSITNVSKRLRFSPECEELLSSAVNGDDKSNAKSKAVKAFPVILDQKFRTKKSHFEEDEQEESDDDPFLGDSLSQNPPANSTENRRKNDQRVPSASSSSSSDEDADQGEDDNNSMEVDQITNLVQFISFSKHQSSQSQSHLQLISTSSVSCSTSGPVATNHWPTVYS